MSEKKKYTAIKVMGIDHWFWFEMVNVKVEDGLVNATGGWGKGGAYTDLNISDKLFEGQIYSDTLQYT
jgi:hypothetical protein